MRPAGRDDVIVRLILLQHEPHGFDVLARVSPVAAGLQVSECDAVGFAGDDPGYAGSDLTRHELVPAAGRLVIEQNAAHGESPGGLPVITGQLVAGNLADTVARARMKTGLLGLWDFGSLTEHLAGTRKINAAPRSELPERAEDEVGSVDVGVEGGEFVVKGVADKALSGQMIAFIGLDLGNDFEDAGDTLDGGGMERHPIANAAEPREAVGRILEGHAANRAVDLVPPGDEELGEVGAVLAGYAGDKGAFRHEVMVTGAACCGLRACGV